MDFNDVIAYTLRAGVLVSVGLLLLGFILLVADKGAGHFSMAQIVSASSQINSSYITTSELIEGTLSLNPISIMFVGLIILIATPVMRVVLGLAQFIKERDYLYSAITAIVFFNLIFAIFILPHILR